jgi:hypothetical protein
VTSTDAGQLETAWEIALVTLGEVCRTGSNDEKVKASAVLLEAVKDAREFSRKAATTAVFLPLLEQVGRNLGGRLTEADAYAPVFELTPLESSNLLLHLSKAVEK